MTIQRLERQDGSNRPAIDEAETDELLASAGAEAPMQELPPKQMFSHKEQVADDAYDEPHEEEDSQSQPALLTGWTEKVDPFSVMRTITMPKLELLLGNILLWWRQ